MYANSRCGKHIVCRRLNREDMGVERNWLWIEEFSEIAAARYINDRASHRRRRYKSSPVNQRHWIEMNKATDARSSGHSFVDVVRTSFPGVSDHQDSGLIDARSNGTHLSTQKPPKNRNTHV